MGRGKGTGEENKKVSDMNKQVVVSCLLALVLAAGCKESGKKNMVIRQAPAAAAEPDTTIYGTCGKGTAMNTLELITDGGDTVEYSLVAANERADVEGGLSVGDRMAVVGRRGDGAGAVADKVLNLTSLFGKWASLGNMFEICDSGVVRSNMKEPAPYTQWSIHNGRLLLSADTFEVVSIGPDSLFLMKAGVMYGYRRLQAAQSAAGH